MKKKTATPKTRSTALSAKERREKRDYRAGLADALGPLLGLEPVPVTGAAYARGYIGGLPLAFELGKRLREKRAREEAAYPAYASEQRALHISEGLIEPSGMTADEMRTTEELATAAGCSATEYQERRRVAIAEARGWLVLRGASAAAAS